jgi:hypothetical protein
MKPAKLALLCLAAGIAAAADDAPTLIPTPNGLMVAPAPDAPNSAPPAAPAPPIAWQPRGTADLQALDKVNDRSADLAVEVGKSVGFGHLTITVRACMVRPPDQPADATAYLDVTNDQPDAPSFHGWMLANEPSVSIMQDPVYDIRVTGCH